MPVLTDLPAEIGARGAAGGLAGVAQCNSRGRNCDAPTSPTVVGPTPTRSSEVGADPGHGHVQLADFLCCSTSAVPRFSILRSSQGSVTSTVSGRLSVRCGYEAPSRGIHRPE